MACPCPRSSAPMPQYAPAVSMRQTTGRRNFSASFICRRALRYPSGWAEPKLRPILSSVDTPFSMPITVTGRPSSLPTPATIAGSSAKRRSPCISRKSVNSLSIYQAAVGLPLRRAACSRSYAVVPPFPPFRAAKERRKLLFLRAAGNNAIHEALLKQKLGALEAFRQLLAHGLLNDPRPREADERFGLGEDHVRLHGEGSHHAAGRRVGQHRRVEQPRLSRAGAPRRWSWPSASAKTDPPGCARRRKRCSRLPATLPASPARTAG